MAGMHINRLESEANLKFEPRHFFFKVLRTVSKHQLQPCTPSFGWEMHTDPMPSRTRGPVLSTLVQGAARSVGVSLQLLLEARSSGNGRVSCSGDPLVLPCFG